MAVIVARLIWTSIWKDHWLTASHAGYVVGFLCVWRISALKSCSASTAFISQETYIDVVLSCQHAVLLIKATRDFTPNRAVHLELSGSDCCCEDFFSAKGSFVANKQESNFQDLRRNASKMNRLIEITSDGLILQSDIKSRRISGWKTVVLKTTKMTDPWLSNSTLLMLS